MMTAKRRDKEMTSNPLEGIINMLITMFITIYRAFNDKHC